MGIASANRRASRLLALTASLAWLLACSNAGNDTGNGAPCSPGAAACGAAAAGFAGGVAGAAGMAVVSGSGGDGAQTTAGVSGTAGATAGASGAAGVAGSAGSAGEVADAGVMQDGAIASDAATDAAPEQDANVPSLPFTPLYRLAVRIHAGESALTDMQFMDVTTEVNLIWRSQAAVCFEFELVDHDELGPGLDIWYRAGSSGDPNGYYSGDNDIFSRDQPSLGSAPNPVQLPTARTTAHEFGHGLGLSHQDFGNACPGGSGNLDCNDLLMRSGRAGFFLSDPEIDRARSVAEDKALDDTSPQDCGPLVVAR